MWVCKRKYERVWGREILKRVRERKHLERVKESESKRERESKKEWESVKKMLWECWRESENEREWVWEKVRERVRESCEKWKYVCVCETVREWLRVSVWVVSYEVRFVIWHSFWIKLDIIVYISPRKTYWMFQSVRHKNMYLWESLISHPCIEIFQMIILRDLFPKKSATDHAEMCLQFFVFHIEKNCIEKSSYNYLFKLNIYNRHYKLI